ncbi:MAG: hypothetical protein ACYS30_24690 [Planctomycetota bacterium]
MSFEFGIPGVVRRVIPGIGTKRNGHFNIGDELKSLAQRLAADQDVVDSMSMPGWGKIMVEYQGVIVTQWEIIKALSLDAQKNAVVIQQRRHLIEACELLIETMKLPAERHHITAERQKQLERVEQERRSHVVG